MRRSLSQGEPLRAVVVGGKDESGMDSVMTVWAVGRVAVTDGGV